MTASRTTRGDAVRDQRIERLVPLITPQELFDELGLDDERVGVLLDGRAAAQAVLDGEDDRLMVVVGPCSVHDVVAAREYAERLSAESRRLAEDLLIVMRVYFEKPRTTIGWKGLINDPHLDGSGDVNTGLRMARRFLLEVLGLGLPIGCEFLDPISPQYISDLVSWGAIGARTTESQIHRQLGSGLSMPVGYKNGTNGDVQVAVDAVRAAGARHAFAGIDADGRSAILHTRGNPDCHIILRGGKSGTNFDSQSVAASEALLRAANLPERIVIDVSHDNSGKRPERQPEIAREVGDQVACGDSSIKGVMIESFLVDGNQAPGPLETLTYGQSITDGCIGWDTTVEVLDGLAADARTRRSALA
ncbi:MAG: 3-deoxy-7-phosphoheptulonate synthase [Conexibacteraceae bacterium]|nr:3-deoxy-7-phosphoheptulonate synthase [Conexibacteraceae bacterium]